MSEWTAKDVAEIVATRKELSPMQAIAEAHNMSDQPKIHSLPAVAGDQPKPTTIQCEKCGEWVSDVTKHRHQPKPTTGEQENLGGGSANSNFRDRQVSAVASLGGATSAHPTATGSSGGKFTAWDGSLTPPSATEPKPTINELQQQLAAERETSRKWEENADAWCNKAKQLREQLAAEREKEKWLGELLAVIHCDGGHYQSEHGIEKATKDAITKRTKMVIRIDELETQLDAERELAKRMEEAAFTYGEEQLTAEREEHAKALLAKQTRIEIIQKQLAEAQAAMKQLREGIGGHWMPMDTNALSAAIAAAQKPLADALEAIDVAYQRVPDTSELRKCVFRGDFNELGDKIKNGRDTLAKVKEGK